MSKKGFTLVELLAVIVILAIILAIAIPSITSLVKTSTRNAFEIDLRMIIKTIELKMLEDDSFNPTEVNENNMESSLNLDNSNYESVTVKEINDDIYVTIVGQNKWDGLTATGTLTQVNVSNTNTDFVRGTNAPILASGMIPIKWNGTTWVDTTKDDIDWYNYNTTNKIWANARTADGSMWVWIPRFIYKINSSNWHTSVAGTISMHFTKGIDDNWDKDIIGNINLSEDASSSNGTWTNHPAFTFGDTELTGFWMAKFEASGTTETINFKPNVSSFRSMSIGDMFNVSRNMETNDRYGWGTSGTRIDTHLLKNTEWGAVAYLASSSYGKNDEIWMNNSSDFITGCTGDSATASPVTGCANAYNTTNGVKASTSGNIYGIYDMAGGTWEYTAAYVNNGGSNLANGSSIINADSKYKNVYTASASGSEDGTYELAFSKKGDAVYETSNNSGSSSWNGDYSYMPNYNDVWFERGGGADNSIYAGVFCFGRFSGINNNYFSFRTVLAVGDGL